MGITSYYCTYLLTVFVGAALRFLIFFKLDKSLQRRIELVTPVTSWYRVQECITLVSHNINPYEGDTCHQLPYVIWMFKGLMEFQRNALPIFFIVLDVIAGLCIAVSAQHFSAEKVAREKLQSLKFKPDSKQMWQNYTDVSKVGFVTLVAYMFNPYSILSCVAFSSGILTNVLHAFSFLFMVKGSHFLAGIAVGAATYLSFYSIMLIFPVMLHAIYSDRITSLIARVTSVLLAVFGCSGTVAYLFVQSYKITSSWEFLYATYGFLWNVPDLTPNVGLFWYFFMEMFEHFKLFFLCVFQFNAFLYVIPMVALFRSRPVFLFYVLLSIIALFKSYPAVGDVCIPFALIPIWSYLYRYTRGIFVVVVMFIFTTVLGPVLYHLWLYAGSGNANFFYAVTLAYNLAQVLLLADVVIAYVKWDFHLYHGLEPKTEEGEPGIVKFK